MSALISHTVSPEDIETTVQQIVERLQQQTHLPAATINQQLDLKKYSLFMITRGCFRP